MWPTLSGTSRSIVVMPVAGCMPLDLRAACSTKFVECECCRREATIDDKRSGGSGSPKTRISLIPPSISNVVLLSGMSNAKQEELLCATRAAVYLGNRKTETERPCDEHVSCRDDCQNA